MLEDTLDSVQSLENVGTSLIIRMEYGFDWTCGVVVGLEAHQSRVIVNLGWHYPGRYLLHPHLLLLQMLLVLK
jgi:uncharacterized membrane protein